MRVVGRETRSRRTIRLYADSSTQAGKFGPARKAATSREQINYVHLFKRKKKEGNKLPAHFVRTPSVFWVRLKNCYLNSPKLTTRH